MSDSGNFIARWSRLKQRSATRVGIEARPGETVADPTEGAAPEMAADTAAAFDPTLLPPVSSIVAGTDVRPFLQAGVPAALTQAALRSTWAADPAIRDFIEIAENQWDFNDPAGIPGFAPIGSTEVARGFVGDVPGALANAPAALVAMAALTAPPQERRFDPPREVHVDQVWLSGPRTAETPPCVGPASPGSGTSRQADAAVRQDPTAATGRRRGHGSALPK
jgi:hypothetical protein